MGASGAHAVARWVQRDARAPPWLTAKGRALDPPKEQLVGSRIPGAGPEPPGGRGRRARRPRRGRLPAPGGALPRGHDGARRRPDPLGQRGGGRADGRRPPPRPQSGSRSSTSSRPRAAPRWWSGCAAWRRPASRPRSSRRSSCGGRRQSHGVRGDGRPHRQGRFLVVVPRHRPPQAGRAAAAPRQARLRAFFEATSDAIGVSCRGVHVVVNPAYARLFGFERPEDLLGRAGARSHRRDRPPPRRRADPAPVRRRRGPPGTTRCAPGGADGGEFLMELRVSSCCPRAPWTTVVMVRDVTAERDARGAARRREPRYRELFDHVPVGVWEEDLSGVKRILDGLRARGVADLAAHLKAHPEVTWRPAPGRSACSTSTPPSCETGAAGTGTSSSPTSTRCSCRSRWRTSGQELLQLAEGRREHADRGLERHARRRAPLDGGARAWWPPDTRTTGAGCSSPPWTSPSGGRRTRRRPCSRSGCATPRSSRRWAAWPAAWPTTSTTSSRRSSASPSSPWRRRRRARRSTSSQLHIREAALRARDLIRQILTFGRRDRPSRSPSTWPPVVREALALARAGIPATVDGGHPHRPGHRHRPGRPDPAPPDRPQPLLQRPRRGRRARADRGVARAGGSRRRGPRASGRALRPAARPRRRRRAWTRRPGRASSSPT